MYFSLSTSKGDKPIAKIYTPKKVDGNNKDDEPEEPKNNGGKKPKPKKVDGKYLPLKPSSKCLYLNELEKDDKNRATEFILPGKEKLKPLMCRQVDGHANRIFCAGGTLCGKSFMAGKLAKDYQKTFPKNKVCLFSWVDKDKAYDKIKDLHKIRIDDSILEEPIELDELHDSVCIFDDIQHFSDKHILMELERLQNSSVNAGRHKNIDVIIARQNLLDGHKTKTLLNSCFQVIAYPHSAGRFQFGEWLRRHMALEKPMIQRILNLPSRWVLINRSTPPYCLHEKGCFLLS